MTSDIYIDRLLCMCDSSQLDRLYIASCLFPSGCGTDLAVAEVLVVLHIREQDAAQLLDAVGPRLAVEGLLPVCAVHVLVHPASSLPPLCIPARHADAMQQRRPDGSNAKLSLH